MVTGGARGIGAALARALAAAGARVAVADVDAAGAEAVAGEVGGLGLGCDVGDRASVASAVARVEAELGPVWLCCSNAGIFNGRADPPAAAPAAEWEAAWRVNVLGHVHLASALVPRMVARGGGWFLITVSAAGLLSQIGSATYATTKHAALGFAEHLAISHRDQGIGVCALCPQAVDTPMVQALGGAGVAGLDGVLSAEAVAQAALEGLRVERFLILPHPEVAEYAARKAADRDRWIAGMARLQAKMRS